jgi:hypothetical protein
MEILALRHQLVVLQRTNKKRLLLRTSDRILWIVLSRFWPQWREYLDHVVILNEISLRRHLVSYLNYYYHGTRSHLSLGKDSPDSRPVQAPEMGKIFAFPKVGGLHHRYERRAA